MGGRVLSVSTWCGALLLSAPAATQVGSLWTPAEMLRMADVAVIADCGATRDGGHLEGRPGVRDAFPTIERETIFVVREVLKATEQDAVHVNVSIRLRHYGPDLERWRKAHPPAPGEPPPAVLGVGEPLRLEQGLRYILFLRRAARAAYEPLSGHTWPARSVHRFVPGDRP